jgi:hypothetical protein
MRRGKQGREPRRRDDRRGRRQKRGDAAVALSLRTGREKASLAGGVRVDLVLVLVLVMMMRVRDSVCMAMKMGVVPGVDQGMRPQRGKYPAEQKR